MFLLSISCQFGTISRISAHPYALRISCGSRAEIRTPPTNTLWYKDYAYTGGIPANSTRPSFITPLLSTLRYFPLSEGLENCYNINRVPTGHYFVRVFYGLVEDPNFNSEPLFDVSIDGTLVESFSTGWSTQDDQVFTETLVFLTNGGDPWGGDRFWSSLLTLGQSSDKPISIEGRVKLLTKVQLHHILSLKVFTNPLLLARMLSLR